MNLLENKMLDKLKDLKENHCAIGIKAEFAQEGTKIEEALRLKDTAAKAGLDLTIKIGGCEAIKDMNDAKTIGADTIVAPMIESVYAVKKYVDSTKIIFSADEWKKINFLINIETISGFNCLDDILKSESAKDLTGIVLGRSDMAGSLGMSSEDINHDYILKIASQIAEKTKLYNKEFAIGGGVSVNSLPFFKKLPQGTLKRFETRKVIFDAHAIHDKNVDKGILKAIEFELMWIKNKKDFYNNAISSEDLKRIAVLEARYKATIS